MATAPRTITAANAVVMISCPSVFNTPQQIQGFATEDAWNTPQYEIARAIRGVDNKLSAGYVGSNKEFDIFLQGDSISRPILQEIEGAMTTAQEVVFLDITLALPSISEIWEYTRGVLTNPQGPPAGKKTLDLTQYKFVFEDIQPAGT